MMKLKSSSGLIVIAGIMVFLGFLLPLLIVAGILPNWLLFQMFIAVMQMIGFSLGIIGIAMHVSVRKKHKDHDSYD